LIDRELYLPASWIADRERCQAAGVPAAVGFATKIEQMQVMLTRAFDAGVPFAWFTAEEAYGQVKAFRVWLEQREVAHVVATRCNDTVSTRTWGEARIDALIAALPHQAWKRRSAGAGAHGARLYDWARVAIRPVWDDGWGHWVLARRSLSDPTEIAYYVCYGPAHSTLQDLIMIAGSRWAVEECFQTGKSEAGLDHYQVRRYDAW
jgi:SRSO17 transposase